MPGVSEAVEVCSRDRCLNFGKLICGDVMAVVMFLSCGGCDGGDEYDAGDDYVVSQR